MLGFCDFELESLRIDFDRESGLRKPLFSLRFAIVASSLGCVADCGVGSGVGILVATHPPVVSVLVAPTVSSLAVRCVKQFMAGSVCVGWKKVKAGSEVKKSSLQAPVVMRPADINNFTLDVIPETDCTHFHQSRFEKGRVDSPSSECFLSLSAPPTRLNSGVLPGFFRR